MKRPIEDEPGYIFVQVVSGAHPIHVPNLRERTWFDLERLMPGRRLGFVRIHMREFRDRGGMGA